MSGLNLWVVKMNEEELFKLSDNLYSVIDALEIADLLPFVIADSNQDGIGFIFINELTNRYSDIECLFSGEILAIIKTDNFKRIWEFDLSNINGEIGKIKTFMSNKND
jgi:hypothetical protein